MILDKLFYPSSPYLKDLEQVDELTKLITTTKVDTDEKLTVSNEILVIPCVEEQKQLAGKLATYLGLDTHFLDILLTKDEYVIFMIKAIKTFENARKQLEVFQALIDSHLNEKDSISSSIVQTQQDHFLNSEHCNTKVPLMEKGQTTSDNLKKVTASLYEKQQKRYGEIRMKIQDTFLAIYNKRVQQSEIEMNQTIKAINAMDGLHLNFNTIVSNQIDSIKQTIKAKEMLKVTDRLRETNAEVLLHDTDVLLDKNCENSIGELCSFTQDIPESEQEGIESNKKGREVLIPLC